MRARRLSGTLLMMLGIALIFGPMAARAADSDGGDAATMKEVLRELKELRAERKHDRQLIKTLETKVDQLESRDSKNTGAAIQLENTNRQLQATNLELQQTASQVKTLQAKLDEPVNAEDFSEAFGKYLGSHSFTVTGSAGGQFVYDQQSGAIDGIHHGTQNSFFFDWEPMILYRPADWILFEGVLGAGFGSTGTGVDLSTAEFQLFPNDYLTIVGGLFDNPFGDWFETQSPMWVNRFVTAPLPFGVESVVPPGDIGVQARGGFEWGAEGQDFDYTAWIGNGPEFSSNVLGAALGGPVAVANAESNGKAFGTRLRIYPIPVDKDWGRLEVGASTYDGKWNGGNYFTSWGVDFNYLYGNFQTRGEWVSSYREMPSGLPQDNRQGWYLQLGYMMSDVRVPGISDELNKYFQRLQPLIRYSGVNQHFVSLDDITGSTGIGMGGFQAGLVPDFGLSGSPALYAPHSREVALALDYWFAPSIVWQNEVDFELPRAGGTLVAADGSTTPAGSVPNDHAFLTQFTVGF
ncbi:MAG TPA: hypothetical protein VMU16_13025 [Candidatus Binataceae bacterium]|nr:hypothetical protein [Candidatus Binataceae bacterium]